MSRTSKTTTPLFCLMAQAGVALSMGLMTFFTISTFGLAAQADLSSPPTLAASLSSAVVPTPAVNWQRMLTCNQGRMWVDVDTAERRHVQLVTREPVANQFIAALQVNPTTQAADLSQMTFEFRQDVGIFKPEDFAIATSLQAFTFIPPVKIGDDYMTQYAMNDHAFRDTSGGLKIEFVRTNMQICSFYDAVNNACSGGITFAVRDRYIGNWYFSGCQ